MPFRNRGRLRERYGLKGNKATDLVYAFFACVDLVQQDREIEHQHPVKTVSQPELIEPMTYPTLSTVQSGRESSLPSPPPDEARMGSDSTMGRIGQAV